MRRKKTKEQLTSIIVLSSVLVFFVYLKMNPEVNSTSLSSEVVNTKELEKEIVIAIENDEQYIQDNQSTNNVQDLEVSESIIEYTESELNRAKAYLNRGWKPDHTINSVAWEYVSRIEIEKDETGKNQVVNAIK